MQGFGLDIKGGKDRPYISDDPGIFVSALKHAGLAEKSGNINVGDKIVEVCKSMLCIQFYTPTCVAPLFKHSTSKQS